MSGIIIHPDILERARQGKLTELNLSNCYPSVGDEDVTALVEALKEGGSKLKDLGLADNAIEDKGLHKLSELSSLEKLDLSSNAVECINPLLSLNKIVWLGLSGNNIGNAGFIKLLMMSSLRVFIAQGCGITDADDIEKAVKENTTLTMLALGINDISSERLARIESYIERNRLIKEQEEKSEKGSVLVTATDKKEAQSIECTSASASGSSSSRVSSFGSSASSSDSVASSSPFWKSDAPIIPSSYALLEKKVSITQSQLHHVDQVEQMILSEGLSAEEIRELIERLVPKAARPSSVIAT